GEIIFTFDGDAAGQKAALRAFQDDQRFVGQPYLAVGPDNMDPCELRLAKGDAAVRDLVARREPLIAFALRSVLSRYDLETAEGRVGALRATAPLVAKIKDHALRPEYVRKLAGDLGMELETVQRAVGRGASPAAAARPATPSASDSPQEIVEREALKLALQVPVLAGPMFDSIAVDGYHNPVHVAVRAAIAEAAGAAGRPPPPAGHGRAGGRLVRVGFGGTGCHEPRALAARLHLVAPDPQGDLGRRDARGDPRAGGRVARGLRRRGRPTGLVVPAHVAGGPAGPGAYPGDPLGRVHRAAPVAGRRRDAGRGPTGTGGGRAALDGAVRP